MSDQLVQIKKSENSQAKEPMYIHTFGCQMNEYDTKKMQKLLEDKYYSVDAPEKANLVIVNTCSVRDKPEQKLFSMLGELRDLKVTNPKLLIGVAGCVAQQEGSNIVKRSRAVDFVFGTHNISLVPSLIDLRKNGAPPQVAVGYREDWEDLPLGVPEDGRASRFIAISRGCNKNCTYCIVPTTRGPEVSRSLDEIKREVKIAAHNGVKEIVLLGQTVNSYGLDLTPRLSFVHLLDELSKIEGIERFRFTSPHPQEVRQDFIDLVTNNPKICRHIHMPLQSGSDRILKLMNRNYRRTKYLKIIESLKAKVPEMAITTDIIVGFPGETRADFEQTLELMDLVRFENSYSFVFSPRPGTVAETMEDPIPAKEKLAWLQELQARQDVHMTERLDYWVGKQVEVLIDGPSAANPKHLQGRSSQNFMVNIDPKEHLLSPGMIIKATVYDRARHSLKAHFE